MPHSAFSVSNTASTEAMSSTSQGMSSFAPIAVGERLDAAAEGLALIGEGELGALPRPAPWRCPRRWSGRWPRPSPGRACPSSVPSCRYPRGRIPARAAWMAAGRRSVCFEMIRPQADVDAVAGSSAPERATTSEKDGPATPCRRPAGEDVLRRRNAGTPASRWCRRNRRSSTAPYRASRRRGARARSGYRRNRGRSPRYARSRR